MNDPFFISREALENLFDTYYHIEERTEQAESDAALPELVQKDALLALCYPEKSELSAPERKFVGDVLAAIGVTGKDTATYFREDLENDAVLQHLFQSHAHPFAFLFGRLPDSVYTSSYTIELVEDTQLFILERPEFIMQNKSEKQKLWNLIKNIPFTAS
ncbi:MAG: hypothetical protein H6606_10825 [Flavobacteriales bacterium]|nr:hypothetical protein [Flavobacteriales bacterium]